jgi:hypothetical protein
MIAHLRTFEYCFSKNEVHSNYRSHDDKLRFGSANRPGYSV